MRTRHTDRQGFRLDKHSVKRLVSLFFMGIYLLVALLNTSVVQSTLGAWAGSHFSREWGGTVRVGALHASPISHIILDDVLLVAPDGDTILTAGRLTCRFKRFPFHSQGLKFDRVYLRDANYHLSLTRISEHHTRTNLHYIIDHYRKGPRPPRSGRHFLVEIDEVLLRNIAYRQDMTGREHRHPYGGRGVDIDHMRYSAINARVCQLRVDMDDVKCRVMRFAASEVSGVRVDNLSADVHVSPTGINVTRIDLATPDSRVLGDVRMEYDGWHSMRQYCHNVKHDIHLLPGTAVNLRDAAYWAPMLWGADCRVALQGHCHGPVEALHADSLYVAFGRESYLHLDGTVEGLPHIAATTFRTRLHPLHTSYDDLMSLRLPDTVTPFRLPELLSRLGRVNLEASLSGSAQNCVATLSLNSGAGDLEGRAALQYDSLQREFVYVGELDSRAMGVRALLPNEWVSRTGFHFILQGSGLDPDSMEASVEGRLYNTRFRGVDLARTTVSAELTGRKLNADVVIHDSLIDLDLTASTNLATHAHSLDLGLRHAHLTDLHLLPSADSSLVLTTQLRARLQGDSLEHLTGTLAARDTRCSIGTREVRLDDLTLSASEHNGRKQLDLASDWFSLAAGGYFHYADLPLAVRDFCDRYLPVYYNPYRGADSVDITPLLGTSLNVDMQWRDTAAAFRQLLPAVDIAAGSSLHASYSYGENLRAVLRSDYMAVGGVTLTDMGLSTDGADNGYRLSLRAASLAAGALTLFDDLRLDALVDSRTSTLALRWDDSDATVQNEGDLEFFFTSSDQDNKFMVTKPTFYVMGDCWNIVCPNGMAVNRDRVEVSNLKVYGMGQSVSLKALLAHRDDDYVRMAFDDFSLGRASQLFLGGRNLSVEGTLDGLLTLQGLATTPYLDASLTVDSCLVNGQRLGRVGARSSWDADESRLYLDLTTDNSDGHRTWRPVEAHGSMPMGRTAGEMDFYIDLQRIDLQTLGPLLANVAEGVEGWLGGSFHLHGTPAAPQLDGTATVSDGQLQLTATGVTYYFADEIKVSGDTLTLHDFAIHDARANTALVNGTLAYRDKNLLMDLGLATDRLLVLDNRAAGGAFSGTVLVSATGRVEGPVNALSVTVNATTLNGSDLRVPISNSRTVIEQDYIHFISDQPVVVATPVRRRKTTRSSSGLRLAANLQVTPGMRLSLPMDFSELAASVNATGRGDIQFSLEGDKSPQLLGNYEFASGSLSLSLLSLIDKTFSIEQGSTLIFPGSVDEARFDLRAVYNQRVNLATLTGTSSSTATSTDTYVQVQDVIALSGTLQNPSIGFDIRLPNAEQSVTDQVFSYIDRNNERDMLNQTVSLLLLGRFASTGAAAEGDNILSNGFSSINVLTSTASSMLSNMVKVVDVNFKYQAGTETTGGQFDVGISKEWNKFYFESSFGYGNQTGDMEATDNSDILVGDVVAGYKITPYIHMYGFHRNNTSYYTRTELPYKQGVGVKLTKDFDSFSDIVPWLRRRGAKDGEHKTNK